MLSYKEFVAKYPKLLSLDKKGILKITTITSMYHFNITFNIPFVVDNLPLDPNFIINIKYGDNKTLTDQGKIYYRVIDGINNVPKKKNNTINKKKYIKHKNVDKQIRLEFKIKEEKINFKFKVFENGTIQATGSKNFISVLYVIYNFIEILKTDKRFLLTGHENLDIEKITYFDCAMMNCKADVDFKINRLELFKILREMNLNMLIKFDPLRHASVSIKFNDLEQSDKIKKEISIFIFEKGSILINGGTIYKDLIKAYKFIMIIILKNKDKIKIN